MHRARNRYLAAFCCQAVLAVVTVVPGRAQGPIPLDTLHASAGARALLGAARTTRSVDILDRRAIEALPARSLGDVIARALGVDLLARSAASADVAIRGSSTEQVLVLIDGVPVNDDQTGHFHLDVTVPLDAVERIEVLRGPAATLYGSAAVGGVINIVTRRREPGLAGRLQGGSFGALAGGLEAATRRDGWGARLSAEHDRADGHRPGTDHAITQTRLALDAPVGGGGARLDLGYAARDFGANSFYAPFDSYEETRALTAALSWAGAPARLTVQPRISFRRHEDDFILRRDDPAFYRNQHTSRQWSAELVGRWSVTHRLNVAAGTETSWGDLESTNLGDRAERRLAAFAELAAGDVERGLITAGFRLDDYSTFGSFLSPSLAAGYRVSPAVRLRASLNRGFRAPSWTERFYQDPANLGSPELDGESFWAGEVGADLRLGNRATVDLAAFVRHASDVIDWARPADEPTAPWRTLNIQQATFRGVEATSRAHLAALLLTGHVAFTGFSAALDGDLISKYALRPLTRVLSLEAEVPIATVTISARAAHHRRAGNAVGAVHAGSATWETFDARVAWTPGRLQLFADVTNIAGADFADVTGRPAPGRAFGIGARFAAAGGTPSDPAR